MSSLQPSMRLGLSYVLDWLVLIAFAVAGGVFSFIPANRRPFALTDPAISFPYGPDTVSIRNAGLVAIVAPAAIILAVSMLTVRAPNMATSHHPPPAPRDKLWKRRLWEWHTGWLGLFLSVVLAFFVVQAMKNLFGKPRPDFLQRCDPDLANRASFVVGGYAEGVQMLGWRVCRSKDGSGVGTAEFEDGFRSFPSGHCSISFAGLVYLSLFLATKFAVAIPWLNSGSASSHHQQQQQQPALPRKDSAKASPSLADAPPPLVTTPDRRTAAAPPLYLLVVVLVPVGVAIFIASTRFTDFKHAGFDILTSSLFGVLCAWFGFRWYHLPVRRGAGWSWGPRYYRRAFGIGVGITGYVADPFDPDLERASTTATAVATSAAEQRTEMTEVPELGQSADGSGVR